MGDRSIPALRRPNVKHRGVGMAAVMVRIFLSAMFLSPFVLLRVVSAISTPSAVSSSVVSFRHPLEATVARLLRLRLGHCKGEACALFPVRRVDVTLAASAT